MTESLEVMTERAPTLRELALHGVEGLHMACRSQKCRNASDAPLSAFSGDETVHTVGKRAKCRACGCSNPVIHPNWKATGYAQPSRRPPSKSSA